MCNVRAEAAKAGMEHVADPAFYETHFSQRAHQTYVYMVCSVSIGRFSIGMNAGHAQLFILSLPLPTLR